jgi:hypothetical protein
MRALLEELRSLGCELHFAGVGLSPEEKEQTLAYVDEWIHDFQWPDGEKPGLVRRVRRKLTTGLNQFREACAGTGKGAERPANMPLDDWFHPSWLAQARRLQKKGNYRRLIVPYVIHSAFFKAFDTSCLKVLDCHDVFTDRNSLLREAKVSPDNYWISLNRNDERRGLLRADVILGIQDKETSYFQELTNGRRLVRTVGHFMTTEPLPFEQDSVQCFGYLASGNPLNQVGFQWFLDEVWPIVRASGCDAKLLVAGEISDVMAIPHEARAMGVINSLKDFYGSILFAINPIPSGTGLKIKTVESIAYGRAIVTTPAGVEGMEIFPGITVASKASAFAESIIAHLDHPVATQNAGMAAAVHLQGLRDHSLQVLNELLHAQPTRR